MKTGDLFELVENEVRWRLGRNRCETCGRGASADGLPATALSQMLIGLQRLELAREKTADATREEGEVNPLALVATISKLPAGYPARRSMLDTLEGLTISLQGELRRLRAEEDEAQEEA